jgi:predicted lipoprotein with Yx(FWY)xxD motif
MRRFGRRKFDKQPTQPAAVLIAAPMGDPIPSSAVRAALARSAGGPVAVVTIARIYGSSMGLPNPGLMPTRKELEAQKGQVEKTLRQIEKGGGQAWGQVAASRKPVKAIAQAAKARGARHVIVVRTDHTKKWRAVVEGNIVKDIARKLGPEVHVEGVSP